MFFQPPFSNLQWKNAKGLALQSLVLSLATAATQVYGLVDQAFVAKISESFLRTHYYTEYAILIFAILGRIFGQTLLVSLSKTGSFKEKGQYFSGAIQLIFLLCTLLWAIGATALYTQKNSLDSTTFIYLLLFLTSGLFMGINIIQKFALIAQSNRTALLKGEIAGNVLNIFLNFAGYQILDETSHKLLAIGLSTLITQIFLLVYYLSFNSAIYQSELQIGSFLRRSKKLLGGEFVTMTFLTLSPLAIGMIFDLFGSTEIFVTYNFAIKWAFFLAMPLMSLTMLGTVELSTEMKSKLSTFSNHKSIILAGLLTSGIPSVVFAAYTALVGWPIQLPASIVGSLYLAVVSLNLLSSLGVGFACQLRALEQPSMIGYADVAINILLRFPLLSGALYFASPNLIIPVIMLILYMCEFFRLGLLRYMVNKGRLNV